MSLKRTVCRWKRDCWTTDVKVKHQWCWASLLCYSHNCIGRISLSTFKKESVVFVVQSPLIPFFANFASKIEFAFVHLLPNRIGCCEPFKAPQRGFRWSWGASVFLFVKFFSPGRINDQSALCTFGCGAWQHSLLSLNLPRLFGEITSYPAQTDISASRAETFSLKHTNGPEKVMVT